MAVGYRVFCIITLSLIALGSYAFGPVIGLLVSYGCFLMGLTGWNLVRRPSRSAGTGSAEPPKRTERSSE
jgi:hypothetical protein